MNVPTIAWKGLRQRALASGLTAFSVALGVMLMVAVLVIYAVLQTTFSQRSIGYDLIVGPKGSPMQLVLSTVYHTNAPIENLPYRFYRDDVLKDPRITEAIPVAFGDTTQEGSFPIIGTIPRYFLIDYAPNRHFRIKGGLLQKPFDALIGARVAQVNGWDIGTTFRMVHGGGQGHVHDEEFTVVGLLEATGTPNDKSVFVHLDGFYQVQGHDKPFGEAIIREREFFGEPPLSDEELDAQVKQLEKKYAHHDHSHGGKEHFHDVHDLQKEVTSILVKTVNPIAAMMVASEYKAGFKAQAVNPIEPMRQLMVDVLGGVKYLLLVLTGLIIAVSGIGIFVSIYNSMAARKREIAIMRALGARRGTVLSIILAESIILCVGGGLIGLLMGHGLVFVAAPIVERYSGLLMDPWAFEPLELSLLPALFALALVAGVLPAMTAYRTDVAEGLSG